MMTPMLLFLLVAVAGVAGFSMGRSSAAPPSYDAAALDRMRHETAALRELVARLKDTAWDHRELDSPLATIVIDEIRSYEKKELGP